MIAAATEDRVMSGSRTLPAFQELVDGDPNDLGERSNLFLGDLLEALANRRGDRCGDRLESGSSFRPGFPFCSFHDAEQRTFRIYLMQDIFSKSPKCLP